MVLCKECSAARGQSDVSFYLGLDRNIQYTGDPLSTLRCSLPFGFLRLSLFSHVIAPDFFSATPEYCQHTKAARADAGRSMVAPNLSGRLTHLNSEKPHACWSLPLHQTPFLCVLHLVLACVRCRHFALSHFRIFRRL